MVRIKLMDGSALEIPREEAYELIPYRGVFVSPLLRSPVDGLLTHRGKILPVLGPMPANPTEHLPAEERAWLLLMKGCAQVVRGMPEFEENRSAGETPFEAANDETGALLQELDQLLKAA